MKYYRTDFSRSIYFEFNNSIYIIGHNKILASMFKTGDSILKSIRVSKNIKSKVENCLLELL